MAKDDLDNLDKRIKQAKGESPDDSADNKDSTQQGLGFGIRAGLEMVVAMLVGLGIGYFLDGLLETRPFLMLVFGFLGMGAGISNIFRLFNKMDMAVGYKGEKKRK